MCIAVREIMYILSCFVYVSLTVHISLTKMTKLQRKLPAFMITEVNSFDATRADLSIEQVQVSLHVHVHVCVCVCVYTCI